MGNDKYNKYPKYSLLSYFRWRFLIQSKEYDDFYKGNNIASLIQEEEKLLKERKYIFDHMEEFQGELHYNYNDAVSAAHDLFADGSLEEDDFDDKVEEIISKRSEELKEELSILEDKLNEISKKELAIRIEAMQKFKLKAEEHGLSQFLIHDGEPEDHLTPKFFGHGKITIADSIKKDYQKNKDHDLIIRTITRHDKFGIEHHMLRKPFVFAIDRRFLEEKDLHSIIYSSFRRKVEEIWQNSNKNNSKKISSITGRARFVEWNEYLQAYRLKKVNKKTSMEIARLMGAKVTDSSKVIFSHKEMDAEEWNNRYRSKGIKGHSNADILVEKKQLKENINNKIDRATKLAENAGQGIFPGFEPQLAIEEADKRIESLMGFLNNHTRQKKKIRKK